jgi:hypothetical protein
VSSFPVPSGQVCPELLVLLCWVIQKLVDGLVIDVFPFGAYSLRDFLLESSGDLLGRPAQLQLLKDKAPKGGAVAQEIFLVGVALSCFGSLVGFNGAIDTISLVSFQLRSNA